MTFDLCVPAFNEAPIISASLTRIRKSLETMADLDWRIILVDNASTDGTAAVANALNDVRVVVTRTETKGKGAAIVHAASTSEAEVFGFIDADLSADPDDLAQLLSVLAMNEADVVIGSRLLNSGLVERGLARTFTSRVFNLLRHLLLGVRVEDSQCGLKAMNASAREILSSCKETGWFLDMEFLARAERAGMRIREVPVHWREDVFHGRESKLRLVRDALGAVIAMVRIRNRLS